MRNRPATVDDVQRKSAALNDLDSGGDVSDDQCGDDAGVSEPNSSPEQISVLTALYQAERSDASAMQTINSAVVALAVAYGGATAVLFAGDPSAKVNGWLAAVLPAPLWVVAVFLASFTAAQARRILSALVLERALLEKSALPMHEREVVGVHTTWSVTEFHQAAVPAKLSLVVAFGGELLLVSGYTVLMLERASAQDVGAFVWIGPGVVYLALFALVATVWISAGRERQELVTAHRLFDRR